MTRPCHEPICLSRSYPLPHHPRCPEFAGIFENRPAFKTITAAEDRHRETARSEPLEDVPAPVMGWSPWVGSKATEAPEKRFAKAEN
jgi:hypothetical protein